MNVSEFFDSKSYVASLSNLSAIFSVLSNHYPFFHSIIFPQYYHQLHYSNIYLQFVVSVHYSFQIDKYFKLTGTIKSAFSFLLLIIFESLSDNCMVLFLF
eukprot:169036_1